MSRARLFRFAAVAATIVAVFALGFGAHIAYQPQLDDTAESRGYDYESAELLDLTFWREDTASIQTVSDLIGDVFGYGEASGYQTGYDEGYEYGFDDGWSDGYGAGFSDGEIGFDDYSYELGYEDGYYDGSNDGYSAGYSDGSFEAGAFSAPTEPAPPVVSGLDSCDPRLYVCEDNEEPAASSSTGSTSWDSSGDFCDTHDCIDNFENGQGYIVQCNDGMWSQSGGIQGACSHHGGVR